ncbi:hypothetical protein A2U01_0006254, partial [Trifolium medium]|nr:hypothetical protein [Trifolium medium]
MADSPDPSPPLNPPSTPISDEVWVVPEIHQARSLYVSIDIDKVFRVVGNPDEWVGLWIVATFVLVSFAGIGRNATSPFPFSTRILRKFVDSLEAVPVPDPCDPSGKRMTFHKRYIDTELILSEPSSVKRDVIFGGMKDVKKWQRMRAILEKGVALRLPKPVEVVSDKPRRLSSKRRAAGAIAFKPHVERKREVPVVPVGKGKAVLVEDVPSSRMKAVKHFGEGSPVALPLPSPLVEALPSIEQDFREGVSARTCVFPHRPLVGPETEVEGLMKLLRETTLREEK